jgi:uncharacterized protein YkwD
MVTARPDAVRPRTGCAPTIRRHRILAALAGVSAVLVAAAPVASARGSRAATAHRAHHPRAQVGCANADTSIAAASKKAIRGAVVCLINEQREAHQLPALHARPTLDSSAQRWTNTMVITGQFTHGVDFAGRISAAGFNWSAAGENIATGYRTPRQVVTAWMGSTGHCQNILDPSFEDVGTGVNAQPIGQYGGGTWTQDFGLSMGTAAPSGNTGPANGCPYHV